MGKIIFLPHPGKEHISNIPGAGYKFDIKTIKKENRGIMPWNDADKHARKFIHSIGDFIDAEGNLHRQEKIAFWGEWEQESYFFKTKQTSPERIHIPMCKRTEVVRDIEGGKIFDDVFLHKCSVFYKNKQNTDPYVFGERFYYSCCRQTGKMLELDVGDMIIFFSGYGKKGNRVFVLDTVFVVGGRVFPDKKAYKSELNLLRDKVTTQYLTGVILPICYGNTNSLSGNEFENILYYGVMFDNNSNKGEIYSFFPCKKAETDKGYERYILYDEKTNAGLGRVLSVQNKSYDENVEVASYWSKLKADIERQGFLIGVKANEPNYID